MSLDHHGKTQKKNKQRKNQSVEGDRTQKKTKSLEKKGYSHPKKPILEKYKF